MSARLEWSNTGNILNGMQIYQQRVKDTIYRVAQYWQVVFEQFAKENAPWRDRTGNARQSLHSFIERLANDTVALYISHGVRYGILLETRYAGRYAILWRTIQTHLIPIRQMLQGIFGR